MRADAVIGLVASVAGVAGACGGDTTRCANGFGEPVLVDEGIFTTSLAGGNVTIVRDGRSRNQLVLERRGFAGGEVIREIELTPDGYESGSAKISPSGEHLVWVETFDRPRWLRLGRITADAIADVVTVIDLGAGTSPIWPMGVVETPRGHAVLWGDDNETFLSLVDDGVAGVPIRLDTEGPALLTATDRELAIAWSDGLGTWLERRGFDGVALAPRLEIATSGSTVGAVCWDGVSYQIVVDFRALGLVRTDGTDVRPPVFFTNTDSSFPSVACGGGESLVAWTRIVGGGSPASASEIVTQHLDERGEPLDAPTVVSNRPDNLAIDARVVRTADNEAVVWDSLDADTTQVFLATCAD